MHKIAVVGAPSSAGARHVGQEHAPQAFRRAGLVERLNSPYSQPVDFGDLREVSFRPDPEHPKQQNLALVSNVAKQVADQASRAVQAGAKPLVLGGDCTVTIGVLAGLARHFPNLGVIYCDGDIDLNTPADSPSGILDGMVMANILGVAIEPLMSIGPRFPLAPPSNIILFGDNPDSGWIDEAEVRRLAQFSLARYSASEIRGKAGKTATEALSRLGENVTQILVHFDVDVIDHREFPAADVPHDHGLGFGDALEALGVFVANPRFAGLVITEFNANRDPDGALAGQFVAALAKVMQHGSQSWEGSNVS